jgi:hypothetical protein
MTIRIPLNPAHFTASESTIATMGASGASGFTYPGGIAALRLRTPHAEVVILPFLGQQIWRAAFDGRDVTMRSMFDAPVVTDRYLETYGAFFIHCGATAIGAPGPKDHHPLHGELPLARYDSAVLLLDEAQGQIALEGTYHHRVAFTVNYLATSTITLGTEATALDIALTINNHRTAPMDLMYLGHANFQPVPNGELVYSAPYTPAAVTVRQSVPAHISPPPGYGDFVARLATDPALHHRLTPDLPFDPEVVFSVAMQADEQGRAHAMQVHPEGHADFISYDADNLPMAIRWVCRTDDQAGLGLALPSTSGVEGYTAEKAAGRVTVVPPKGRWQARMQAGTLTHDQATVMRQKIDRTAGRI